MNSLLIAASASRTVSARWLIERVASGLQLQNYLSTRADVARALSDGGLPSMMVTVPDPSAPGGRREFQIWVEEQ